MREHLVTISLQLPQAMPHTEVQARVLKAVGAEFADERGSPLSVGGYDRKKAEKELAETVDAREEYRKAWLDTKADLDRLKSEVAEAAAKRRSRC